MSLKNYAVALLVLAGAFSLSGCGNKVANETKNSSPSPVAVTSDTTALPTATGKVSDLIDATVDDANVESSAAAQEDMAANNVADDANAADDFANNSDEKNL